MNYLTDDAVSAAIIAAAREVGAFAGAHRSALSLGLRGDDARLQ
jgi:hypothetical protein